MCCDPPAADRLPPRWRPCWPATGPWPPSARDWGDESAAYAVAQPYSRWLGNRLLAAVFGFQVHDWPETVRACLTDPLPAGLTVATLEAAGTRLRAGLAPYVLQGGAVEVAVVLDNRRDEAAQVEVGGTPGAGRGQAGSSWPSGT